MLADIPWNPDVIGIICGCAIPIVGIIAYFWHKTEKAKSENDLKRSMIERGMSADEIERVVAAGSHDSEDQRHGA